MIIGLNGLSGSGKDTVAKYLVDNYGYRRMAFADPLREFLYHFNPSVRTREGILRPLKEIVETEGWHNAQLVHPEVRKLLQRFATDFVRNKVDSMFWVKLSMFAIDKNADIVFSDVRFANEADTITKHQGVNLHINSDRAKLFQMNHASEVQVVPYQYQIDNNGSLDDLYSEVDKFMNNLGKVKI